MSTESSIIARMSRALVIQVIAIVVVYGIFMGSINGGHKNALAECTKTENAGKCGSDIESGPVVCGIGQPTCLALKITFGTITNCGSGGKFGLSGCGTGQCTKTVITQQCMGGICEMTGMVETNVLPTSFANGSACGGGGGTTLQQVDQPRFQQGPLGDGNPN